MKKYNITFLFDINNDWIKFYFDRYKFQFNKNKRFSVHITYNLENIREQDVVFPLSYTRVLDENFLKINKKIIIAHPSKLPKDMGFAPLANQILRGQNYFYISLIKAEQKVDTGKIFYQKKIKLNGTELNSEIRKSQAINIFKMVDIFLSKFPNNKSFFQKGDKSFNKRRKLKDSKIEINKSLKDQFNLLRVVDNENYPAFFKFRNQKYFLKIYKSNDPLVKNAELKFIVKKTDDLKKKEIDGLINLKRKYWKYSKNSHQKWFKENIKINDVHFLGKKNDEVVMYCCLRLREIKLDNIIRKFYYLDTLCSYKQYNKIFSFMSVINKIIDNNFCILLCDKKHVKFYEKFNFKVGNNYSFQNHSTKKFKVLFKIDKNNKSFKFFTKRKLSFKI